MKSVSRMNQAQSDKEKEPTADNPYAAVYEDDQRERFTNDLARELSAENVNALSEFIVLLLDRISQEPCGAQNVRNELQLTLESLFKHSAAFNLAFELYAKRYNIDFGSATIDGPYLDEWLTKIKAAKLDDNCEVLIGFERAKGIDSRPAAPIYQDWMTRLGATIAGMYEADNLSFNTYAELSDCMLEISNSVSLPNYDEIEARLMLPHFLRCFWASEDEPKLLIRYGSNKPHEGLTMRGAMQTLCTIQAPDICGAFEKVVRDFDRIFAQTEEEAKATRAAENYYVIDICLERKTGNFLSLHQCLIPLDWFSRLEDYVKQHAPAAPEPKAEPKPDPAPVVHRIADYGKVEIDYYASEEGDKLLDFQIVRGFKDSDEIYFNTYSAGINTLTLNRDGYKFPMHNKAKDWKESIVLEQGRNIISFLGQDDIPAFKLDAVVRGEKIGGGVFYIYDHDGEMAQGLTLWK